MGYVLVCITQSLLIRSLDYVSHYYPQDLLTGKACIGVVICSNKKIAQVGQHGSSTNVTLLSCTGRKHSWNKFGAKLQQRKQLPLGRRICGFEDVAFSEGHIFCHPHRACALCTIPHIEVRIRGILTVFELANLCQWCEGHHASKQWSLWRW